jgi:hypothetical protein
MYYHSHLVSTEMELPQKRASLVKDLIFQAGILTPGNLYVEFSRMFIVFNELGRIGGVLVVEG